MSTTVSESARVSRAEFLDNVREAVRHITARYDRSYFLERARGGGDQSEIWQAMADNDLLAIGVPEELGGMGGGLSGCTVVMDEMSSMGVPPLLYSLTTFSREAILLSGTPEQIRDHVIPTISGDRKICFGVTEPEAGTNSFAMRTRAVRRPDGSYVINGQKVFISAADEADHMLLVARTAGPGERVDRTHGLSLFIIDLDTPGVERTIMDIEWYAPERQCEVFLTDVEVPESALIGAEGAGFSHLLDCLNQERVSIAAWALGLGTFALRKAVDYAKTRAPFGSPIGGYQAVQHPLALAAANIEAARQMMYAAAAEYDDGGDPGPKANMAKLLGSRAALQAVEAAIQTHGGSAFVLDNDVVTLWPMVRVLQIAPLNNESILNYIGEHVLGLPRSF
jgi:alkylation response protein AidB-like acyl-CoA dehydrogenase